jgi:hypothetical protein
MPAVLIPLILIACGILVVLFFFVLFWLLVAAGVLLLLVCVHLYLQRNGYYASLSATKAELNAYFTAAAVGAVLVLGIIGMSAYFNSFDWYDPYHGRADHMFSPPPNAPFWSWLLWFLFATIASVIGLIGGFAYLLAKNVIFPPPRDRPTPYLISYVAVITSLTALYANWPKLMLFLTVVLGIPFGLAWLAGYQPFKKQRQRSEAYERCVQLRDALNIPSADDFANGIFAGYERRWGAPPPAAVTEVVREISELELPVKG